MGVSLPGSGAGRLKGLRAIEACQGDRQCLSEYILKLELENEELRRSAFHSRQPTALAPTEEPTKHPVEARRQHGASHSHHDGSGPQGPCAGRPQGESCKEELELGLSRKPSSGVGLLDRNQDKQGNDMKVLLDENKGLLDPIQTGLHSLGLDGSQDSHATTTDDLKSLLHSVDEHLVQGRYPSLSIQEHSGRRRRAWVPSFVKSLWPPWDLLAGQGTGDHCHREVVANVATSIPFLVVGATTPRIRKNAGTFCNSVMGVGLASSLYHISRGKHRKPARWMDHVAIAASTACLTRALYPHSPATMVATIVSAAFLPFQPLAVASANTILLEATFLERAIFDKKMRKPHRYHAMSTALAGIFFALDEYYPDVPMTHAGWHCCAALSTHFCSKLLH